MNQHIPQYAYTTGEINSEFFGRTDLVKYSEGAALLSNFYVGQRGGVYSRAGFHFVGQQYLEAKQQKLFRFRSTTDDYVLEFGPETMRVARQGGYIVEADVAITDVSNSDPVEITALAHGYSDGDVVILADLPDIPDLVGRYLVVQNATTNTFELEGIDSTTFGSYVSGGKVNRVYTLTTPFLGEHVSGLSLEQEFDKVTITHLKYHPKELTRVADDNWTIGNVPFSTRSPSVDTPTIVSSANEGFGILYGVTVVRNGQESLLTNIAVSEISTAFNSNTDQNKLAWTRVHNADYYNVYASIHVPTGADITKAQELGYIGRAYGATFVDNNITPDFTKTAPFFFNPFAVGSVLAVNVTAVGTGYGKNATISVTGGGGSGFKGSAIVTAGGNIIGVIVHSGGEGYSGATVSFAGAGSGAAGTVVLSEAEGTYPRLYRKFQQRGVYGGSENFPMSVWGSRPKQPTVFDVSRILNDGDAYGFELDASVVKPIQHMVALRTGLLVFTQAGVTQLRAEEGRALTPLNALAEPQIYNGVSDASPVPLGLDVIFSQSVGGLVNAMQYTEYTNSFTLVNLSALSNHLVQPGKEIVRMEFMEAPDKLLWCLREDGTLLTLTYDAEEKIYGWAQHETRGIVNDCVAVQEDGQWKLYASITRHVNGEWVNYLEVMEQREQSLIEDYWCVDAGLKTTAETPAATLQLSAITGTITATASASVFTAGDVGKVIFGAKGKAEITGFTSGTEVECLVLRDFTNVLPQLGTSAVLPLAEGDWELYSPTTEVSGLWHLEGETVSVLADGDVQLDVQVTDGKFTLTNPASKIIAGLPYWCVMQTLPVASRQEVLEGRSRHIYEMSFMLHNSRGMAYGEDFNDLVEFKERGEENWDESILPITGVNHVNLNTGWNALGQIYAVQKYPLPACILAMVATVEGGDDAN